MNILDTLPVSWWHVTPLWNAEGGGGAGDGGSDGGTGDGGEDGDKSGDDGGGGASWLDGLSDDDKAFVGDRDLAGLVEYAKSQRTAAGARVDAVTKEHGLIKPLAAGDEVGEFFRQFRPGEAAEYGKALGKEGDNVSAEDKIAMEAAFQADLHPDQFKRYEEQKAILREGADKEAAQAMMAELEKEWGADKEANFQAVDKAAKALGLGQEFLDAFSKPGIGATPADIKALTEGLKNIGLNMREGGGTGDNDTGDNAGQTPAEQRAALEQEIIDGGKEPTKDQRRRLNELNEQIAKEMVA